MGHGVSCCLMCLMLSCHHVVVLHINRHRGAREEKAADLHQQKAPAEKGVRLQGGHAAGGRHPNRRRGRHPNRCRGKLDAYLFCDGPHNTRPYQEASPAAEAAPAEPAVEPAEEPAPMEEESEGDDWEAMDVDSIKLPHEIEEEQRQKVCVWCVYVYG